MYETIGRGTWRKLQTGALKYEEQLSFPNRTTGIQAFWGEFPSKFLISWMPSGQMTGRRIVLVLKTPSRPGDDNRCS